MKSRAHEIALKSQKTSTRFDASKYFSVQLALLDGIEATKEGLMALAVQTGLRVIHTMMQQKNTLVGPKGPHHPERKAVPYDMDKRKVPSPFVVARWLWRKCEYAA